MNERLKEIAVKAQVEHCISHVRLEEFAELIIQECAKVADIADDNNCEWIGGNILTHFGIVHV